MSRLVDALPPARSVPPLGSVTLTVNVCVVLLPPDGETDEIDGVRLDVGKSHAPSTTKPVAPADAPVADAYIALVPANPGLKVKLICPKSPLASGTKTPEINEHWLFDAGAGVAA